MYDHRNTQTKQAKNTGSIYVQEYWIEMKFTFYSIVILYTNRNIAAGSNNLSAVRIFTRRSSQILTQVEGTTQMLDWS